MPTPPISQLCKNCSQVLDIDLLLDHNPINNKGYRPYDTDKTLYRFEDTWPELPGLAASGDSGCGLCKLIRDAFASQSPSTEYKGPVTGLVSRYATWIHEKPRKILDYSVRIYGDSEGYVDWSTVTGYAQFFPCSDDDEMPFLLPPPAEIMSAQTVDFLKRSIDQCESTCHPREPSGSIPSRLLDISDYKTRGRIQLVQTEKLPRVKYAALSYCWGNADDAAYQPKTNSANLSERLNGFGIDTMSPVVRDAIITCQALEMRYLWVDALCILQGKADVADWDIESQKMTDIFRNAYITICPSSSNSCREGFLGQRLVHPGIRVKTPITSNAIFQNESREYSILPYFGHDENTPSFINSHEFINSKWYSRAWVWQEVNFSARLVIFTPTFVFYRCPETLLCENGARKETTIIREGLGEYHSKRYQDAQPFAFFRTCVEDISSKDISFESDRLAAVAGVARQVSQATGSQYAAGLWVKDIYKDLIFERNLRSRNNRAKGGLEKYIESLRTRHSAIGPTWSWPGHRAGVCWDSNFS
ncbi:Heterokaryon incompatibility [Fusarium oxysporum f. sp. vasinfectum]|nr:Heterokaryon incompatibility [Fusarium oxysporum f. sp. vasinfectum]